MRMLRTDVNIHIPVQSSAKPVFWEHPLYCLFNESYRAFPVHLLCDGNPLSSRVSGMTDIFFLVPLVAGKSYFFGIDNNNIVAAINMRREICLMFSPEGLCNHACQTSESRSFSVNNHPFLVNSRLVR